MPVVDYGRWWDNCARLLPFGRSYGHLEFVLNVCQLVAATPFGAWQVDLSLTIRPISWPSILTNLVQRY